VNGYMTPELWLQRGVTYTFNIEGGDDPSTENFYNPLYISDEPFGGYMKLSDIEKKQIHVFLGIENGKSLMKGNSTSAGRLCVWSQTNPNDDPDKFKDFQSYREALQLQCRAGNPGVLQWTPDRNTSNTVYYQSYVSYNMGWKIVVVDEIPPNLPDFKEAPYKYEIWLENNIVTKVPKYGGSSNGACNFRITSTNTCCFVYMIIIAWISRYFFI